MDEFENTQLPEEGVAQEEMPLSLPEGSPAVEEQQAAVSLTPAQESVLELIKNYPGLSPADIPQSVWQDFSAGRGRLAELYTRSENSRLRADNESLRARVGELEQLQANRLRSTSSRRSEGSPGGSSIIDSVWYSD